MCKQKILFVFALMAPISLITSPAYCYFDQDINSLPLHELLKIKTTTAAKREHSLQESPAFVEIISQNDLQRRGYKDLSYLLDDLAGIQISRTYGDNYFSTLWRGVRHTIGSSYLILIDGIKFNHLYNNETEILASLPMSNIKHIEVVYGPGSVAYGHDAVVGIINIITDKIRNTNQGFIQVGENNKRVIDLHLLSKLNDFTLSFSARVDDGDVDFGKADQYRWTDPELLRNPDIWGGFTERFGGLSSPHKNRGIDLRLFNQNHELAVQYFQLARGYGLEYTFDHSLPDAGLWYETDSSFSWRWQRQLDNNLRVRTLLRNRHSDIDDDSFFIEGYLASSATSNQLERLVDASYWESINESNSASAELSWQPARRWNLLAGIELENKNLQKAYNIQFGPSLAPRQIALDTYPLPSPPTSDTVANNHIKTRQRSLYALAEYLLSPDQSSDRHNLHFGLRSDNHSEYNTETSFRTGYVGQFNQATFKLFYGEAFQEPSARLLYGGWQGSGSDPDLNPRDAATWEFNANYQFNQFLISANLFQMESKNLFNTTDDGAVNAGKAHSEGGNVRVQYRSDTTALQDLSVWLVYSRIKAKEQNFNLNNQLVWQETGDLADSTIHFGSYLTFNPRWQLNLRGRYYGDRIPVDTNPLDKIDEFIALDLNLSYSPTSLSQLKLALDVTNLFDKTYFHPGVRSASASMVNSGSLNNDGVWIGSESFYNAQIPQPGRELRLSLYWRF